MRFPFTYSTLFYVLIFLFFKIIIDTIYTIIIAIGITTNLSEGNKYQRIKTKIVLTFDLQGLPMEFLRE